MIMHSGSRLRGLLPTEIVSCLTAVGMLVLSQPWTTNAADPQTAAGQGEIKTLEQKPGGVPFAPLVETVITQSAAIPEVKSFPKELLSPQFATVLFAGKKAGLLIAKKDAQSVGYDTLLIDGNGDGELAANEILKVKITERPMQDGKKLISGITDSTTHGTGDGAVPFIFEFRDNPNFPLSARITYLSYMEAKLSVSGDTVLVGILDKDFNGVYGDPSDLWVVAKGESWPSRPERDNQLSAVNEGRFADGYRYAIKFGEKNQIHLSRTAATGPAAEDLALHRVRIEHQWADRFDKERESFVKSRQVDSNRPKTDKPILWRYVTFDQAKALAKESGKPLFVDVMAFWCVWCYRMDYYTYIDQEVAQVLGEKFIPVKIVQEQDPANDYQRIMNELNAKGIPAMGIWNAQGEKVHQIAGWKKPEDFLTDLKQGLEKAAK